MNGDGVFYSLPYVDPFTNQVVVTPHYDARTGQSFYPWETNIVPVEDTPAPSTRETTATRSYEDPWYVDTINRAIERAAQVATIEAGGYPPYPSYPTPSPTPVPMPAPVPGVQPQQSIGSGIQLSQTTLMLIVGGFLLFTLGKRGR